MITASARTPAPARSGAQREASLCAPKIVTCGRPDVSLSANPWSLSGTRRSTRKDQLLDRRSPVICAQNRETASRALLRRSICHGARVSRALCTRVQLSATFRDFRLASWRLVRGWRCGRRLPSFPGRFPRDKSRGTRNRGEKQKVREHVGQRGLLRRMTDGNRKRTREIPAAATAPCGSRDREPSKGFRECDSECSISARTKMRGQPGP